MRLTAGPTSDRTAAGASKAFAITLVLAGPVAVATIRGLIQTQSTSYQGKGLQREKADDRWVQVPAVWIAHAAVVRGVVRSSAGRVGAKDGLHHDVGWREASLRRGAAGRRRSVPGRD